MAWASPQGARVSSDWALPSRRSRSGGEAGHGGNDREAGGEVGTAGPQCLGLRGLSPVGLALGPGREVAFVRWRKGGENGNPGRGTSTSIGGRGRQGPGPRGPPLLGKGAFEQGSDSHAWARAAGPGSLLQAGHLGCNAPFHLPTSAQVPLRSPRSHPVCPDRCPQPGFVPRAVGLCSPSPRGWAACEQGPGPKRALTCGLEAGARQGSHPSHFPGSVFCASTITPG